MVLVLNEPHYRKRHQPERQTKEKQKLRYLQRNRQLPQPVPFLDIGPHRHIAQEERHSATVQLLGKMLAIPEPKRMESFDISNISGTDIVASMVVFQDGKPKKSDYKRFKLEGLANQDDYASMHQILKRRFTHYKAGDKGFAEAPDLLLIDGGVNHARVAVQALQELELSFPVFGMVKDDRHRTRALVTPEGHEIRIDNNQAIFALIGNIQEETHRFAITYHRQLRSKRLRYSETYHRGDCKQLH